MVDPQAVGDYILKCIGVVTAVILAILQSRQQIISAAQQKQIDSNAARLNVHSDRIHDLAKSTPPPEGS